MHTHTETRHSPYAPQLLYAMVMDVEKYPEFLPWCKAARIVKAQGDQFTAELVIGYQAITESYRSKVVGNPDTLEIHVEQVSGPFKHLTNHWRFESAENGTRIQFALSFKFRSKLLTTLLGSFYTKAVEKMTRAFLARADALYKQQLQPPPLAQVGEGENGGEQHDA